MTTSKVMGFVQVMVVSALGLPTLGNDSRAALAFAVPADQPPVIDGALNEAVWTTNWHHRSSGMVQLHANDKLADPQTSFLVAYDPQQIYFGIRADEPNMSGLVLKENRPQDTWAPNPSSVEVFLDPGARLSEYYQLAADLTGWRYDGRQTDSKWNSNFQVATKRGSDGWTMEIAIPWADLGAPAPRIGEVWGLNVVRNREGGTIAASTWSPIAGDAHQPGKFHTLILGMPAAFLEVCLTEFDATNVRLRGELERLGRQTGSGGVGQRLAAADRLRRELVLTAKQVTANGPVSEFLPMFQRLQTLREKYRSVTEELEVLLAICQTNAGKTEASQ